MTTQKKDKKFLKLFLGIIFDLIGCISYILPGFAEVSDVIWAPLSAWLMTRLYKGNSGKIGAVITFVEEALPFTDAIPTFTLMWLYTYVIQKEKNDDDDGIVIDATEVK
ncbi:hypothetical protein [Kordia jejudonensis]|uniref:hypothetical protein n=1 Tax=Kordia jejudonensis TaxID=1348245 RepID=UPI000629C201|nr:hypothetical protein [Kordia jejudonensis]